MPIIFYFVAVLLLVISFRLKKNDGFMDRDSSNNIKGFFILLIVFWHILNAFHYDGFLSSFLGSILQVMGQLIVSMFLFISGYGIVVSIDDKGCVYSKSIITNRFLRILLYSCVSLIPYFIYSAIKGEAHPIGDYFLAPLGLATFGNVQWFLFAILFIYFICSLVFAFNYKNRLIPLVIISIFIIAYFIFMFLKGMPNYWYDTIICFPLGLFVALYRNKIDSFLSKKVIVPIIGMILSLIEILLLAVITKMVVGYYEPNAFMMIPNNIALCVFFICLTKIFALKSCVLSYLGNISFSVFIMHMLIINCFVDYGFVFNDWLRYFLLLSLSLLISVPMFYLYKVVDKFVTNPITKWNRDLISRNNSLSDNSK